MLKTALEATHCRGPTAKPETQTSRHWPLVLTLWKSLEGRLSSEVGRGPENGIAEP